MVWSLGREDPLEDGMATHSSVLAWRIPWTEEPGGLQSMGPHRVGHHRSDLAQRLQKPFLEGPPTSTPSLTGASSICSRGAFLVLLAG